MGERWHREELVNWTTPGQDPLWLPPGNVPASEFRWPPSDPWVNQRTVDAAEMDALRQRNAQQEATIAKLQARVEALEKQESVIAGAVGYAKADYETCISLGEFVAQRIRSDADRIKSKTVLAENHWSTICELQDRNLADRLAIREVADLVGWEPEPEDYDDDDGDDPWPTLLDEVKRSIDEAAHRERQKINEREFEAGRQQGRKEMNKLGDDEKKSLEATIAGLKTSLEREVKRANEYSKGYYDFQQLKRILGVK